MHPIRAWHPVLCAYIVPEGNMSFENYIIDTCNDVPSNIQDIVRERFHHCFANALPFPVSALVFDMVESIGRDAAAKSIQRASGDGIVDGMIGQRTIAQMQTYLRKMGQASLIERITYEWLSYLDRAKISNETRCDKITRARKMKEWALAHLS